MSKQSYATRRSNGQGKVIFLHNNARPHTTNVVRTVLQEVESKMYLYPRFPPNRLLSLPSAGRHNFITVHFAIRRSSESG